MATLLELRSLFHDDELKQKIQVACIKVAQDIWAEDGATENHANRLLWAKNTFASYVSVADKVLMAVLAANSDLTVTQIQNASDEAIETAVANVVNLFADGS